MIINKTTCCSLLCKLGVGSGNLVPMVCNLFFNFLLVIMPLTNFLQFLPLLLYHDLPTRWWCEGYHTHNLTTSSIFCYIWQVVQNWASIGSQVHWHLCLSSLAMNSSPNSDHASSKLLGYEWQCFTYIHVIEKKPQHYILKCCQFQQNQNNNSLSGFRHPTHYM